MAEPIGALRAELSANAAQFESDMEKARRAVSTNASAMSRSFESFKGAVEGSLKSIFSLRTAVVAAAGIGGFAVLVKRAIDYASAIADASQRTGVGIEALQELQHAAKMSAVDTGTLEGALTRLNRNLGEAAQGSKSQADFFKSLGIAVTDSSGRARSAADVMEQLADAYANAGSAAERTRILTEAFGRAGTALAPMFQGGAQGIRELRDEAQRLGLVLGSDMVKAAEAAGDELDKMAAALEVNVNRVLLTLTPLILRMGAAAAEAAPKVKEFIESLLPADMVGPEEIAKRMAALEVELEKLSTLKMPELLDMGDRGIPLDKIVPPEAVERVRAMLIQLRELDDLLKRAAAGDAATGLGGSADAAKEKIDAVVASLQFELDQLGRTENGQKLYNLAKQAGLEVNEQFTSAVMPLVVALEKEKDAQKAATEASKEHERQLEQHKQRAQQIFSETRTPAEQYGATLQELNEHLQVGSISQDTYSRAVKKAKDALDEANDKTSTAKDLAKDLGLTFTSAFEDAVVAGGKLSDVLRGLEQDLIRLALRKMVTEPLFHTMGGLFNSFIVPAVASMFAPGAGAAAGSALSGGGFEGGMAFGEAFGTTPAFKRGAAFHRGNVVKFASGGVVDRPTLFPMRRRTGLMGEAGPEGVLPLERIGGKLGVNATGMGGSGGNVEVHVHNNNGSEIETRVTESPKGPRLEIIVDRLVGQKLSERNSDSNQALRKNFGAREKLISRG
jgi:hypothetical protein